MEDLLVPRYKVIADYPNSTFSINEILYSDAFGKFTQYEDYGTWQLQPEIYSSIFKKLEWWEEREEIEMPEYVRNTSSDYCFKVKKWIKLFGECLAIDKIKEGGIKASWLIPITKEEYLKYKSDNRQST